MCDYNKVLESINKNIKSLYTVPSNHFKGSKAEKYNGNIDDLVTMNVWFFVMTCRLGIVAEVFAHVNDTAC